MRTLLSAARSGPGLSTGLEAGQIGRLLATLAPVVLGAVGKMQRQGGLDPNGLGAMLGQERKVIEKRAPA
jgi:hypothetical protein